MVTFVNTDLTHNLVTNAAAKDESVNDLVSLVSLPDGVEHAEDRNDLGKLTDAIFQVMPAKLEELINKINGNDGDKVTCIVADHCMGWAFGVAEKMKIRRAAFWPAAAVVLASLFSIPGLLEDGIINSNGTPMKKEMAQLAPTMPALNPAHFSWVCIGDLKTQNDLFDLIVKANEFVKLVDCIICNSAYELEPATFATLPEILPIGPLLASNRLAKQTGYFWKEDSTCMTWLDQRPPLSVIYVAFGSFTFLDSNQFLELALGLELTNRPFLWVVRADMVEEMNKKYLTGYMNRIHDRGRIVGWVPQQQVLNHPSVACFLTHCGWNSILEGVSSGIPFMCWPYFADQFITQRYISEVWNTGLEFEKDESGIISREEIKNKLEQLLKNEECKVRATELGENVKTAVSRGGHSDINLNSFIDWIQE
ncbi:hypothetical protein L1987_44004 [Smallanthus sonchifolius]|uniref:Uncharacterized protein n=1 Tax=Smallanthus sonchifolius TaxID=185202 RepID=A0ACB9GNW1_9ASTR|nr:hypothetical protein L1987_44004 [Smallanthus sonchifolius]